MVGSFIMVGFLLPVIETSPNRLPLSFVTVLVQYRNSSEIFSWKSEFTSKNIGKITSVSLQMNKKNAWFETGVS